MTPIALFLASLLAAPAQAARLPELAVVRAQGGRWDVILVLAVWAHLEHAARAQALVHLAPLLAPGGRLFISIREGWSPPRRPTWEARPQATVEAAEALGLRLIHRERRASLQQRNREEAVYWHWLGFESAG